jgi:hypothetical protein
MAKHNRENAVRERQARKQAKKAARKLAAAESANEPTEVGAAEESVEADGAATPAE